MKLHSFVLVGTLVAVPLAHAAAAGESDLASLYDVRTDGSTQKAKVGDKGKFVLSIKTKNGSHVSDEAPLKLEVTGNGVNVEKNKLTYADSVAKKLPPGQYADPRFEIPFTIEKPGTNSVDANLTFFICTDKVCARQSQKIHLPVEST